MHEIGHSFNLGRNDDNFLGQPLRDGEIYSGSGNDDTLERVRIGGREREGWSMMRSGYEDRLVFTHSGTTHFAYSIEGLSTIQDG